MIVAGALDLRCAYADAAAVAYVSLYEGFGAAGDRGDGPAGAPVMASNTSSLPEVAGDAALLVDPTDEAAIADALRASSTDTPSRTTSAAAVVSARRPSPGRRPRALRSMSTDR